MTTATTLLATVPGEKASYSWVITALTAVTGGDYFLSVKAYNSKGDSPFSGTVMGTTATSGARASPAITTQLTADIATTSCKVVVVTAGTNDQQSDTYVVVQRANGLATANTVLDSTYQTALVSQKYQSTANTARTITMTQS